MFCANMGAVKAVLFQDKYTQRFKRKELSTCHMIGQGGKLGKSMLNIRKREDRTNPRCYHKKGHQIRVGLRL